MNPKHYYWKVENEVICAEVVNDQSINQLLTSKLPIYDAVVNFIMTANVWMEVKFWKLEISNIKAIDL